MGKPQEDPVDNHVSGQSNKPISAPPHALGYEQVAKELGGDIQDGLSQETAKARLEEYGRNEFGEQGGVQPVRIFIAQIANALTLVSTRTLPRDTTPSGFTLFFPSSLGLGELVR